MKYLGFDLGASSGKMMLGSFDGEKIQSTSDVKAILKKHKIGDNVKMVVDRDSKEIEVEIVLQAQTQAN